MDILPPEADSTVQSMAMSEKPDVNYSDIGGMDPRVVVGSGGGVRSGVVGSGDERFHAVTECQDIQKQEIKEAVELPLTHKDIRLLGAMMCGVPDAQGST